MKAKLMLWPKDSESPVIEREYDWNDVIQTAGGPKRVSEISIYDDCPTIDGQEYRIMNMRSYHQPH